MADFNDYSPIFVRTEAEIRADWDTRANAGMTLDDLEWVDTRQGSSFWLLTQPQIVEHALGYDRLNEVVAAAILSTSWGESLDRHATSFGEERNGATSATGVVTFTGPSGTLIGTGVQVSPEQDDPDIDPPIFETTQSGTIPVGGTLNLAIRALAPGVAGNLPAHVIEVLHSGVPGITNIDNGSPTGGGAEAETDAALKERLQLIFQGKGSGTIADYSREALQLDGVGRVTVIPHWNGPGTVQLVLLDADGDPVTEPTRVAAQAHFDPRISAAGAVVPAIPPGSGWAPINHEVTVSTGVRQDIDIVAQIDPAPGFSLDGDDTGAIAIRAAIQFAIMDYINNLEAGQPVIRYEVIGAIMRVEGVTDIVSLTIEGNAAGNVAVGSLVIPRTDATFITLTQT